MISEIAQMDKSFKGLEVKDCIFRINRDIRFSKDKTPYKMMMSAVIAPQGKKSRAVNGVYFEFGPENLRVYGGVHEIDKDDLLTIREAIAENSQKFKKIYSDPKFVKMFGKLLGEKNKLLPKHLQEKAELEPLIYNKQWYFYTEFEAKTLLKDDLDKIILECFEVGRPIEKYFNDLIKR